MSVLLKTDPNLGNRKIILPAIGEQEIKNGVLEISQEEWTKLSKVDCGIRFSNVKESEDEPNQKENELVEDEGEDIQKKSEESEILDHKDELIEEIEEEKISDVDSESSEEPVKEEKEETDLSILSREELMELALETAKKAGEKLTQIRVLNKQALIEYLNEKL
jgi:hypothetical protein